MSSSVGVVASCGHVNHLFEGILCENLTLLEKIANVAFHILTLGIPLFIYHLMNGSSEVQKAPDVQAMQQVRVALPVADIDADLGFAFLGRAAVTRIADGTSLEIQIKKCMDVVNQTCFLATAKIAGVETKLGEVTLEWFRDRGEKPFGSENTCYGIERWNSLYGYGAETPEKTAKIVMTNLLSYKKEEYKGVGMALTQAAIEYSYMRGCEGRLLLDACWDSHVFYYKLGMRAKHGATNQEIVRRLQERAQGPVADQDCGSHPMYMPQSARADWKEKIRANPIFLEVKSYLG